MPTPSTAKSIFKKTYNLTLTSFSFGETKEFNFTAQHGDYFSPQEMSVADYSTVDALQTNNETRSKGLTYNIVLCEGDTTNEIFLKNFASGTFDKETLSAGESVRITENNGGQFELTLNSIQ